MIYKFDGKFIEGETWAVATNSNMLFARNERDQYFCIRSAEDLQTLIGFQNAHNIFITWDTDIIRYLRQKFGVSLAIIFIRMAGLVRNISYDLACIRSGIIRLHTPHPENELALTAMNLMTLYKKFLKNECKMLMSLSREYHKNFLQTTTSEVIEKLDRLKPAYNRPTLEFYYQPPKSLSFTIPLLNQLLSDILSAPFKVINGKITHAKLPQTFTINNTEITVGVGGIHGFSLEINRKSTSDKLLRDWDVSSYYPSMICFDPVLKSILGDDFVNEYDNIRRKRIAVKKTDPVLANGLKLVLNSATGRLNDKKSRLYNPQAYIQITLTGQLYLLMVANICYDKGIPFYSLNTDGITLLDSINNESKPIFDRMTELTGLNFEDTVFTHYFARDVNNYFAIKGDNDCDLDNIPPVHELHIKGKGIYNFDRNIGRNCNNLAVNNLIKLSLDGSSPRSHISEIPLADFLDVACSNTTNELFRFYRSVSSDDCIRNKAGRKVPSTDHCVAISEFAQESDIKEDIDYEWYLEKAELQLNKILPCFDTV